MKNEELQEILRKHKLWLEGKEGGERADLHDANLRYADLCYADLHGADLRGANLDFSCFPLWCSGLDVHIDDRQAIQLLYHLMRNVLCSKNTSEEIKAVLGKEDIINLPTSFTELKSVERSF